MVLTVLAVLVIVTFVASGAVKLFGVPMSLAIRDSLDVPPGRWRMIGVLEWLGAAGVAIGLAYRPLGLIASIALSLLLAGAVVTRVQAARRHSRSEGAGLALDAATLVLTLVTATAFAVSR